ncbi:MAG: glycosyltransferase [Bacteroidia bacterium]|nr:glycosyltransferase [Bacteroidia bacterium]
MRMQPIELPRITVVSVSFKQSLDETIRTLESVKKLVYPNLEYLIVQKGDGLQYQEIFQACKSCISSVIYGNDQGPYDAMNKALQVASGDWIWFMNMGDAFPDRPEILTEVFARPIPEQIKILYGHTQVRIKETSFIRRYSAQLEQNLVNGLLNLNHQSMVCRVETLRDFGGFHYKDFPIKADAHFFNSLYYKNGVGAFLFFDFVFGVYAETGISSQSSNFTSMFEEDKRLLMLFNSNLIPHLELTFKAKSRKAKWLTLLSKIPFALLVYRKLKYSHLS